MIDRTTKLKWRRRIKRSQRQVEDLGYQAEDQLEKHFFRRLARLGGVRRFVVGWVALVVLLGIAVVLQANALNSYYLVAKPIPGGTHTEGMVGSFTNASPLFATGAVNKSVSRLIFSGLLRYDQTNRLVGDLAESWQVGSEGLNYTVRLKPNLTWHDGVPLTSEDVVYTFQMAQNPDVKSPLFQSWRSVKVRALDAQTIRFTLETPLAPFVHSLTTGIIPKHQLQEYQPAQLRSADFNTKRPVGAGPFVWDSLEIVGNNPEDAGQNIGLKAFEEYGGGKPNLQLFIIKTFTSRERLVAAFKNQSVSAMVGLDQLPDDFADDKTVVVHETPLTAQNMAFFNTQSDILSDVKVRQALVQAANVPDIVSSLSHPAIISSQPILKGQIGYNKALAQAATNVKEANKLLEQAGWKKPADGEFRQKGKATLSIKLLGLAGGDSSLVAQKLQASWQSVGVETEVILQDGDVLQTAIAGRTYDVLLYGISIGSDPDVFAYWHSTQADPRSSRLNFSDYKSAEADTALEAARSRLDPKLRAAKYLPFLEAWRKDAPALALYQPRFLYVTRGELYNYNPKTINSADGRLSDVKDWMIREGELIKTE